MCAESDACPSGQCFKRSTVKPGHRRSAASSLSPGAGESQRTGPIRDGSQVLQPCGARGHGLHLFSKLDVLGIGFQV